MLYLYRRHKPTCSVHGLKLTPKQKKFYRDCQCAIWITGRTDQKEYPRQATGLRDWTAAEGLLRSIQAESLDTQAHGPTLSDCIERYLESRDDIKKNTLVQHRLVLQKLLEYCESRNINFIADLKLDLVENFITKNIKQLNKSSSAETYIAKVKCFLKEAIRREWISKPLHAMMRNVTSGREQKQPFSEDEIKLILAGAETSNGGSSGFASKPKTLRLLLELMLETGMRVSDAVSYDPRNCVKDEYLWIYTFVPRKTKKVVGQVQHEVYLTEKLKTAIDEAEWFSDTLPFAYRAVAGSEDRDYLAQETGRRMKTIGAKVGVKDCRPHRLRDTFAIRLLLKGLSLDDVSQLLGHSSIVVTEKYYAPWIPSRKKRLQRLLSETTVNPIRD